MRLVSFEEGGRRRIGILDDDDVIDLTVVEPRLPTGMLELIEGGEAALELARRAVGRAGRQARLGSGSVQLLAPIPRPRKNVFAVGRNYHAHASEFTRSGFDASTTTVLPQHPMFFTKSTTSVIGPGEPIDLSFDPSGTTDYEGELAVVIGTQGVRIPTTRAMMHVFGYTIVNDVTARDMQKRHVQWFVGKSPDTFCPMGPCIATVDEIPDPEELWLRTLVNGVLRQEARVADLIFDIPVLISTLAEVMTLEPGDVIATGTPAGVGIGFDPPRFLQPGDKVEVSVDRIGTLSNPVI